MKNAAILVIDDEPTNFEVIETLLSGDSFDVYYASNGEEALGALDTYNPDVILLDLTMPGMDGLEICKRLKIMRKWKSVPIIVVTASKSKVVLSGCLEAGADDFVHKPIDRVELRARIKSMLRIKKQFDRIESLTKLQQKNIAALEHDLGEIGCDLAVWFANELNTPLSIIMERLAEIGGDIEKLDRSTILELVNSASHSASKLEQLTNKFWVYLELALEKKQFNNNETSNIDRIVEQIAIVQSQSWNRGSDLSIELEKARVNSTNQHCEWIVKELLDYSFNASQPKTPIAIKGRVVDKSFKLTVSHLYREASEIDLTADIEGSLGLGLKIVKKVVGIYDGAFAVSTVVNLDTAEKNCYDRTVSITLPLM
jgi:two-component system, sensor histidine kinase and response regulator